MSDNMLQFGDPASVRGNALVQTWFQLIRIAQMHAIDNQALERPIAALVELTSHIAGPETQLTFQIRDGALFVNRSKVRLSTDEYDLAHTVFVFLQERGMGGFTFESKLTADIVRKLLSILIYSAPSERSFEKIETSLTAQGLPFRVLKPARGSKSDEERQLERRTYTFFVYSKLVVLYKGLLAEEKLTANRRGFLMQNVSRTIQALVDVCREDDRIFVGTSAVRNDEMYAEHHAANVAVLAIAMGHRLGMGKVALSDLGMAAVFHDAGLKNCPVEILEKSGPLDQNERAIIAQHPISSVDFLLEEKKISKSNLSRVIVAFEHHRHNAGTGFPPASRRPDLLSRIVTICDVYDALTTRRPWRSAYLPDQAVAAMLRESGPRFDPALLKAFVAMLGVYPVGSLVRLDNGQLGVVVSPGGEGEAIFRPLLTLIGHMGQPGATVDLQERNKAGGYARTVVACEDPATIGIQTSGIIAAAGPPAYNAAL